MRAMPRVPVKPVMIVLSVQRTGILSVVSDTCGSHILCFYFMLGFSWILHVHQSHLDILFNELFCIGSVIPV